MKRSASPPDTPNQVPVDTVTSVSDVFPGISALASRLRELNWRDTPLGLPVHWPPHLKSLVRLVMATGNPMWIAYGPHPLCLLFNEAFAELLGERYANVLGQDAWHIWGSSSPQWMHHLHLVVTQGQSTRLEALPLAEIGSNRDGYVAVTLNPILDEQNRVVGVWGHATDETERVRVEHRVAELKAASEHARALAAGQNLPPMESEYSLLRQIFDANLVGIARWDHRGRVTEANAAFLDKLGYTPEDLSFGRVHWATLIPGDLGPKEALDTLAHFALNGKETNPFETQLLHQDGHLITVEMCVAYPAEGHQAGTAIMRDITAEKRVESERQWFMRLLETSQDYIGLANTKGEVLYVNPAGMKMLGLDAFQGTEIIDYIHPEDRHKASEVYMPELVAHGHFSHEIRFRHFQTGDPVWMLWNGITFNDPKTGELLGFATISPNITARKQWEAALQESENRLRQLTNAVPSLVWECLPDGTVTYFSEQWTEYTGQSVPEALGQGWTRAVHPDDYP